jgi:UDP-N-acetylmuramyl pentapeptide synthase
VLNFAGSLPAAKRLLLILQLEGYVFRPKSLKNKRFLNAYIPSALAALSGTAAFVAFGLSNATSIYGVIAACAVSAAGTAAALFAKCPPAKKKLVCTMRVKRFSAVIFAAAIGALAAAVVICVNVSVFGGFILLCMYPALFPVLFMATHFTVLPLENLNRRRYAVRAARTLASRTDLLKIGITGSFGKTSVKNFLDAMLKKRYNTLTSEGSFNTPMGIALTVKKLRSHHEVFIAEMGARRRGDIKILTKMTNPDFAIITGVYPQHMETFKTLDNVLVTKTELAAYMKREGTLVASYDCEPLRNRIRSLRPAEETKNSAGVRLHGKYYSVPRGGTAKLFPLGIGVSYFRALRKRGVSGNAALKNGAAESFPPDRGSAYLRGLKKNGRGGFRKRNFSEYAVPNTVVFAGLSPEADVYADCITATKDGSRFTLKFADGEIDAETRVIGRHNIMNIVMAAALALKMGVTPSDIAEAVSELKPVPHRLELIGGGCITVIDDSFNSNIEGTKAAFDAVRLFSSRKVLLTPGLVELGDEETAANEDLGRRAAEVFDVVLLIGKRARAIKRGLEHAGFKGETAVYGSLAEAQEDFKHRLDPGDVLLIENDLPDNYD